MRLFVTGATGFVGSHFVRQAMAAGHEVVALKRPGGGTSRVPLPGGIQWIEADYAGVREADLAGCDCLVHLGAHSANTPYDTLERCLHWNVVEPVKLFETAARAGVGHYLVAGSCFEYGRSALRYAEIPVDAALEPTDTYPASKAAASVAMHAFACRHQVSLSLLRIFQVYGEGEQESRFWPSLRRAALEGRDFPMTAGEQVRDFVAVEEVARQFVEALAHPARPGEPRVGHVASGQPQTLREFAEAWWTHWKAKGRLRLGEVPYRDTEVMRYVPRATPISAPN